MKKRTHSYTVPLGYIAGIIAFVTIVGFFMDGCSDTVQGYHTNSDGLREGFGDTVFNSFIFLVVALVLYLIDRSINKKHDRYSEE